MSKASKQTKSARALRNLFWVLSALCNFGPVIGFFIYGLVAGTVATTYTMCIAGIVGIIVGIISLILKRHWRTPLIVIMGALYFAVSYFGWILLIVAICIVLDEMIFAPLFTHYRAKAQINKEIDRRMH